MRLPKLVRPLGLRARLTISFALGAALLSIVLAVITWSLTRENLLRQRDDSAVSRVFSNAVTLQRSLSPTSDDVAALVSSLPTPDGAQPGVLHAGGWNARNPVEFSRSDIPLLLQERVGAGEPAKMRSEMSGEPHLLIGVPLPGSAAQYFEAVPLGEIDRTLDSLVISLLGAAAVTTLAGGLVGFWASRRVLVPLHDVGYAAEAIAGGRLDTRLRTGRDHDLDPLVASFNDMAAALETRIDRDARFASEVSHELRSPLMTLAASLEVLENTRDELPERAGTALDLLSADLGRFHQLVEDLLEISRVDVGVARLDRAPVLVTELVIQAVAASGHGRVPVRYEDDVAEEGVLVDKTRFFRAIDNLLDNAERYAGGATGVGIELHETTSEDRVIRIAVEDAGHGVPEEERELIFDRFSRGQEGGNRGGDSGTGLGLALVEEHIHLHGGRVWVEDRPDGRSGARFVIELPALGDEDPEEDHATLSTHTTLDGRHDSAEPRDMAAAGDPGGSQ